MKDLTRLLERAGFEGVRSYIQSGNIVFRSTKGDAQAFAARIGDLVQEGHGFLPKVLVLPVNELERAVAANPFQEASAEPGAVHLHFLSDSPVAPDLESLDRLRAGREAFALKGRVFYLYAPDGFGVSKLAARAERCLGVDATARNWRTVTRLLAIARDSE
jgi:uncharacterized protein (DUF1697 family)